jgi:hypothetical protein
MCSATATSPLTYLSITAESPTLPHSEPQTAPQEQWNTRLNPTEQPQTLSEPPTFTNKDDNNEMLEDIQLFWGDNDHDEDPRNFLNAIQHNFIMKPSTYDTQKLRTFGLHLKSGAAAEQWWNELPLTGKDNWDQFHQAFNVRWPVRIPTAKMVGEKLTELKNTTIMEEELETRVKIQGMEEYAHVVWANRTERWAAAIPDTDGLLINKTWKAMPKVLWKVTGVTHTDWASFCRAICTVTLLQINEAKEKETEAWDLQKEVKNLQDICSTLTRDIMSMFQKFTRSTPSSALRSSQPGTQPVNIQIQHPLQPTNMNNQSTTQENIVDLYSMEGEANYKKTVPFQHTIELYGPQGEILWLKSTFDDGAMVNAIDLWWFQRIKHCLKHLEQSNQTLRMADGQLVPSSGIWNGKVTVGNTSLSGTFEVFDSNGAWIALFGKPLLTKFKAVHDYDLDIVQIPNSSDNWTELQNQHQQEGNHHASSSRWVSHTKNDVKELTAQAQHIYSTRWLVTSSDKHQMKNPHQLLP